MQVDPSSIPERTGSSGRATHNYKDAVSAALAAFESAEDAAAAAKAAVELSRSSQSSSGDHRQSGSNDTSPAGKEDRIDPDKVTDDPVHDSTSESDEDGAAEGFIDMQLRPDVPREITKNKSSSTSSEEEDAVEYFSNTRRLCQDDKNMSQKRSAYAFTGSPLREEEEEEDTFELASLHEKSESEAEKPSHGRWAFSAAPDFGSNQKSNYEAKNNENLNSSSMKLESEHTRLLGSATWARRHSVSYSSEAKTFHSEIGQEKSADTLPTMARRALSVRVRRGLQR